MGKRGRQMLRRASQQMSPTTAAAQGASAAAVFSVPFWSAKMLDTIRPLYAGIEHSAAEMVASQTGADPASLDSSGAVEHELATRAQMLADGVTKTTYDALNRDLNEGTLLGETADELAARVRDLFEIATSSRATLIARSEVVGALNAAAYQYGLHLHGASALRRTWTSMGDSHVRPAHRAADGQTVGMHEPFHIDGHPAQYPGDRTLPPSQSIGCRCIVVYHHS